MERKKIENYIRFGEKGYYIFNDKNNRKIVRTSSGVNTLPDCNVYENGKFIKTCIVWEAIDFLLEDK